MVGAPRPDALEASHPEDSIRLRTIGRSSGCWDRSAPRTDQGASASSARELCLVVALKIHPVPLAGAEGLAQPQRHCRADASLAVEDFRHRVRRHADMRGELAGLRSSASSSSRRISPGWTGGRSPTTRTRRRPRAAADSGLIRVPVKRATWFAHSGHLVCTISRPAF